MKTQRNNISLLTKLYGDKKFVKSVFRLLIPSMLQALISVIILYVDNFSLALLIDDKVQATHATDALGLVNPLVNFQMFITIGWLGGMGIMYSQYFGDRNHLMTRKITALKIWTSFLLQIPIILIFTIIPNKIISLSSGEYYGKTYELAIIYLFFTSFTFLPYSIATSLSFSLQESNKPSISLMAAICGMISNIILDPIVIIFSSNVEMSILFVAISTGIARIIQSLFIILYIYIKNDEYNKFLNQWKISYKEIFNILKHGIWVFINESIFSIANLILMISLLNNSSYVGVITAVTNLILLIELTTVVWPGFENSAAILVGSKLGENNKQEAKKNSKLLLFWGFNFSTILCLILFAISFFINPILSPSAPRNMINISIGMEWAILPVIWSQGVFSVIYYSIRSGGHKIIFVVDALVSIIWVILIPCLVFIRTTINMNPILFSFFLESYQIIKMILAFIAYLSVDWTKVLINPKNNVNKNNLNN